MKYLLFSVIIFFIFTKSNAQPKIKHLDGENITNNLTIDYSRIPGTKVYMVIPKNYKTNPITAGLIKDKNTSVYITDFQTNNFNTNAVKYTRDYYVSQNKTIKEISHFRINGDQAVFADIQGDQETGIYQLLVGDSTYSVEFTAYYPANDIQSANELKNCMLTIYYDKTAKIDPLELSKFELDCFYSKFKFTTCTSNVYYYTTNGDGDLKKYTDQARLLIAQIPSYPQYFENLKGTSDMLLNGLKNYNISDIQMQSEGEFDLNGYKSYNYVGYGKTGNDKVLIYQVITGNNHLFLIIEGMVKADFENNIKEFESLIKTLKLH